MIGIIEGRRGRAGVVVAGEGPRARPRAAAANARTGGHPAFTPLAPVRAPQRDAQAGLQDMPHSRLPLPLPSPGSGCSACPRPGPAGCSARAGGGGDGEAKRMAGRNAVIRRRRAGVRPSAAPGARRSLLNCQGAPAILSQ